MILLTVLLGVVGCGVTSDNGSAATTDSTSSTSTPSSSTITLAPTTTTTETQDTSADSDVRISLVGLGLTPGEPIERPADFPDPSDPENPWFGLPGRSWPSEARIASRFEWADSVRETMDAAEVNSFALTITFVDGYTIWESQDGYRLVRLPEDGDYYHLNDDETWQLDDHFEWPPFFPPSDWGAAHHYADGLLETDFTVVGYELVNEGETVHIRWSEAAEGQWADAWFDDSGAVWRLVLDLGLDEPGQGSQAWMIWDVLTLEPTDIGPLPPD